MPVAVPALALAVTLGLASVGCGTSGSPDPPPTPVPTAVPAPTSGAPTATADAPTAEPALAALPIVQIEMTSGAIVGALGTYDVDGRGSDTPWLPFPTLPAVVLTSHESVTVSFVGGFAIGHWAAVLAAAEDTSGSVTRDVPGGRLGRDTTALTIGPLPAGRWVLQARLIRLDGHGDGVTYWAVTVN